MPTLVHCSYHKCLTTYYRRVMRTCLSRFGGYRHFDGDVDAFYAEQGGYRVASVNNHVLDLDQLGDYRISRFVRDPRDLAVSGYLYHRKGAEDWCRDADADLTIGNGVRPGAVREDESLMDCLLRLDQDDGLIAEIEFRSRHFQSMRDWPTDDPRVRMWRYEDVMGNEERVFGEIAAHYELPLPLRIYARRVARRFRVDKLAGANARHVRDPRPAQWREYFTPRVSEAFDELCGDLPAALGYE